MPRTTYEEAMKNVEPQYQFPKEIMTCNGCKLEEKGECEFAWNPYNTDGDCLKSK